MSTRSMVLFRGLAFTLLALHFGKGSKIELTATPTVVTPALTYDLTLSCGLRDTPAVKKHVNDATTVPYNVDHIFAIAVTRGEGDYVAIVSQQALAKVFVDKSSLKAQGNVSGTSGDEAYLELKWSQPGVNQSGRYRCEIYAMDPVGQPVELSDVVEVKLGKLRLEDLAQTLYKVQSENNALKEELEKERKETDLNLANLTKNDQHLRKGIVSLQKSVTAIKKKWNSQHTETGRGHCPKSKFAKQDSKFSSQMVTTTFSQPYDVTPKVTAALAYFSEYNGSADTIVDVNVISVDRTSFTVQCRSRNGQPVDEIYFNWMVTN